MKLRADVARAVGCVRSGLPRGDSGRAVIEFLAIGIGVIVPLLYIGITFFTIERHSFAVTAAAREAGRAYAQADNVGAGKTRVERAVEIALQDHGLENVDQRIAYWSAECEVPGGNG